MKSVARGVDIGWLPVMEDRGYTFRDFDGNPVELIPFLKTLDINAIRQRVWVNPDDAWQSGRCDTANCVRMCERAMDAGMDFMVDFHYSDSWADPRQQRIPKAWANDSIDEVAKKTYRHTYDTLTALRQAGVTPRWVQTGNEIDCGMMMPMGDPWNHPRRLARLIRAGYDAVHDVFPDAISILHLSAGYFKYLTVPYLDKMLENGAQFDLFGSSYYPIYASGIDLLIQYRGDMDALMENGPKHTDRKPVSLDGALALARESFQEVKRRYGKDSMIVEIGHPVTEEDTSHHVLKTALDYADDPESPCTGVFWWEPEAWKAFSDYDLCAWRDDGTPSRAMLAYKKS